MTLRNSVRNPDGTLDIFRACTITRELYKVRVKRSDLIRWKAGADLKDVLHYVSPQERDFVKHNITPGEYEFMSSVIDKVEQSNVDV